MELDLGIEAADSVPPGTHSGNAVYHCGGMGGHQSAVMKKDEWLTPPELVAVLGTFDLDPCSPISRPWSTAKRHLTIKDDGLACEWHGRVWLNPPYGDEAGRWMRKLAEHGNGIALMFARTETAVWHDWIFPVADSILFLRGRINFHHVSGARAKLNAGAPSALIAYGTDNVRALYLSGIAGRQIMLREGA